MLHTIKKFFFGNKKCMKFQNKNFNKNFFFEISYIFVKIESTKKTVVLYARSRYSHIFLLTLYYLRHFL